MDSSALKIATFGLLLLGAAVFSQGVSPGPTPASAAPTIFFYTGDIQFYTVPAGIECVLVDAFGAEGGQA